MAFCRKNPGRTIATGERAKVPGLAFRSLCQSTSPKTFYNVRTLEGARPSMLNSRLAPSGRWRNVLLPVGWRVLQLPCCVKIADAICLFLLLLSVLLQSKGKGGKNRRRGKGDSELDKRELIFKEDGQEYAQVTKMLGNGRVQAQCFDGTTRLCHIRGKLRKKVWINQGDIVLIGLRDFQDAKGDVILKYNADEARNLKTYGELPESAVINQGGDVGGGGPADGEVVFDDTEEIDDI